MSPRRVVLRRDYLFRCVGPPPKCSPTRPPQDRASPAVARRCAPKLGQLGMGRRADGPGPHTQSVFPTLGFNQHRAFQSICVSPSFCVCGWWWFDLQFGSSAKRRLAELDPSHIRIFTSNLYIQLIKSPLSHRRTLVIIHQTQTSLRTPRTARWLAAVVVIHQQPLLPPPARSQPPLLPRPPPRPRPARASTHLAGPGEG